MPEENRNREEESRDLSDTGPLNLSPSPSAPPPFGGENSELTKPKPTADEMVDPEAATRIGTSTTFDGNLNMGLPKPTHQLDEGATRVSPSAFPNPQRPSEKRTSPPQAAVPSSFSFRQPPPTSAARKPTYPRPPRPPAAPIRRPPAQKPNAGRKVPAPRRSFDWNKGFGCLLRTAFIGLFGIGFLALCALSIMFYQYYKIAATLPEISDLRQRAAQFETTRIYDRNGNILYEILDPSAGRRTYVPLEKISTYMVAATIATEDKGFYSHPGFDVTAIIRAFWQNYRGGEIVSGASTITQQLARNLLLTPEERSEQTYERKMREAILAAEITRRYSKNEILELYMNEIYYGNLAYGVEAASETYFGVSAEMLNLAQASFLAGLGQAPAVYDVYTNREVTLARQKDVLALMYSASNEQGCIYVGNSPRRVCVDAVSVTNAAKELNNYEFKSPDVQMRFPHWVNYIRAELESRFDPQTIYRAGFNVYTTLDPKLQKIAQTAISQQVQSIKGQNAQSGALVAVQPSTGEIIAMVGSADFYNEAISGQVNMAVSPRQPGSSIKPLTYLAAFEKGWTPATLIWDVPTEFPPSGLPEDTRAPYIPGNYDGAFHGPVTVRAALANSYNIPAVKALQFVGIYNDPTTRREDGLIALARRMGLSTLTRQDYGLSLTLGGGEVTLLEMTGAFATMANQGRRVPLVPIKKITDYHGAVVYEHSQQPGEQVIRAEHAYLITSILADNPARRPAFGAHSILELPFPAAVKTGTTNDFRDNWTIGYTPDLAIGVWIGNPDYTPMRNTTGLSGAAPVWANVMQSAIMEISGGATTQFARPAGIVEQTICTISGSMPSKWCPSERSELFAIDQPPLPPEQDLWQKVTIDTWTGLKASAACSEFVQDKIALNVQETAARKWIRRDPAGQAFARQIGFEPPVVFVPNRECKPDDPRPVLDFAYPRDNTQINDPQLDIYAVVNVQGEFEYWQLSYGFGEDPREWEILVDGNNRLPQPEVIYKWDLVGFPHEVVTLRLYMKGIDNTFAERKIRLFIQAPVPTPTPPPTETPIPAPTEEPQPTEAPFPTLPFPFPIFTETPYLIPIFP